MPDALDIAVLAVAAALVGVAATAAWARARRDRLQADLEGVRSALQQRDRAVGEAERIRSVIDEAMADGVLLFDGSGHLVYANPASERHLGKRASTIAQVFPASAAEMVAAVSASRDPRAGEVETRDGWLRVGVTPTVDGGVLVVLTDVTEARRLDTMRRDFVANASHELKTPAASIRAAAETLLEAVRDDPGSVSRFARTLEEEADRLSRIVGDLLDLSRLESGGGDAAGVRLDELVAEEASRFEERARQGELTLRVRADQPVPEIHGSRRDLALLVDNLLDNAIRYTPAGGTVEVRLDARNGDVRLAVADTGIGIPQRDLNRVLERFYRVDRGRSRRTGGTGLGLSIVRHVTENHGGSVSVSSELGRGTTVEILLPGRGRTGPVSSPHT